MKVIFIHNFTIPQFDDSATAVIMTKNTNKVIFYGYTILPSSILTCYSPDTYLRFRANTKQLSEEQCILKAGDEYMLLALTTAYAFQ